MRRRLCEGKTGLTHPITSLKTAAARQKKEGNAGVAFDRGPAANEIEDVDMTEVLEHLEDIDRMSSRKQDGQRTMHVSVLMNLRKRVFSLRWNET